MSMRGENKGFGAKMPPGCDVGCLASVAGWDLVEMKWMWGTKNGHHAYGTLIPDRMSKLDAGPNSNVDMFRSTHAWLIEIPCTLVRKQQASCIIGSHVDFSRRAQMCSAFDSWLHSGDLRTLVHSKSCTLTDQQCLINSYLA